MIFIQPFFDNFYDNSLLSSHGIPTHSLLLTLLFLSNKIEKIFFCQNCLKLQTPFLFIYSYIHGKRSHVKCGNKVSIISKMFNPFIQKKIMFHDHTTLYATTPNTFGKSNPLVFGTFHSCQEFPYITYMMLINLSYCSSFFWYDPSI